MLEYFCVEEQMSQLLQRRYADKQGECDEESAY